jgi:hypothetical protein
MLSQFMKNAGATARAARSDNVVHIQGKVQRASETCRSLIEPRQA